MHNGTLKSAEMKQAKLKQRSTRSQNFRFGVCPSCAYVRVLARVRLAVSAFVYAGVRANFFMESDCVNTFVYMFFFRLLKFLSVLFRAWLCLSLRLLNHSLSLWPEDVRVLEK